MKHWTTGYTAAQLDDAQAKYGVRFPPDLIDLYRQCRPIRGYHWARDEEEIWDRLKWPLESILFDVRHDVWWDHWGNQPEKMADREELVRHLVAKAPKLIPLLSHRYIPETPRERGNPVFSVYQTDIIYYGANLDDYFARELGGGHHSKPWPAIKRIPFWSDFAGSD